jgi:RHS repeat-associated protein
MLWSSHRLRRSGVVSLLCVALMAASVSPSYASERGGPSGTPVVGPFSVGGGIEASVDERTGGVRFAVPLGGVQLAWDSNAIGSESFGLGPGWGFGVLRIGTTGGVAVHPPAGGTYEADASHPSGLSGYGVRDVRFEQRTGTLPARWPAAGAGSTGSAPEEVDYSFVMHELGGTATYYDEHGNPVASESALGRRTEWLWDASITNRLRAVVNPDGVVTTLDWERDPGNVLVTAGTNIPGETDPVSGEAGTPPVWRVALDGGRVTAVVDPVGDRLELSYGPAGGLVTGLSGVSGGSTRIVWRTGADGVARVDRVRTVDADARELSVRAWAPAGDGTLPSGWPAYASEHELFRSGSPARFATELSDGVTRVVSEYTSQQLLVSRHVVARSSSGELVVQEQAITYPGTERDRVADPAALPGNWSRPTRTEVTHRDVQGRSRTVSETSQYDELGRPVSRTAVDGTVTVTEYDPRPPTGGIPPIGLPITRTMTASDGLIEQTRHELDAEHTGVVAVETWRGGAGAELSLVGRAEYDLDSDGLRTAERVYPGGDPEAHPVTTTWDRVLDHMAGMMTIRTTVASGTPIAATTAEVISLRHGGVLASSDAVGNVTRTGYDASGRPVVAVDASGRVSTRAFESAQQHGRNATTATSPAGVSVTEVRDTLGRIVQVIDNIDHGMAVPGFAHVIETREYPAPGSAVITDAWGAVTRTRHDLFGRAVETVGPTGLTEITEHDDVANRVTSGLTGTGRLADVEFVRIDERDLSGRVVRTVGERRDDRPVPTVDATFDGFGRMTAADDGTIGTKVDYDAAGNPVTTTRSPSGRPGLAGSPDSAASGSGHAVTATRRFDGFGVSLEKTLSSADSDARSGTVRTLDALGRIEREIDQLGRATTIEYTPDGLVAAVRAERGQLVEHAYDSTTRALVETTVTSSTAASPVRIGYEYDPVTGDLIGVFDPADRVGTEIRYVLNALHDPVTVTYPDGEQIGYRYDAHGRRTHTIDIEGNTTTVVSTPEGLPIRATQHDRAGVLLGEVEYEYDEFARLRSMRRSTGVRTECTFTSASEVASERTTDAHGRVLAHREYTYDPRGNLIERSDAVTRIGRATGSDADTEPSPSVTAYTYDAHDRLTHSASNAEGTLLRSTDYELTVSGDIRTESVTETDTATGRQTVVAQSFDYSALGEAVAQTITRTSAADRGSTGDEVVSRSEQTYDAAGNLLRAFDGQTYEYDAANRPTLHTTPDGRRTEIGYWADGSRRYAAHGDGEAGARTTTGFYWDGGALLNDTHSTTEASGTGVASYLIGTSRHSRTTLAETGARSASWYGTDRHGNVTELTDEDGRLSAQSTYTDYGRPAILSTDRRAAHELHRNPFGYAGEYTDPGGTQYLRARIYDPDSMRFTTMDTAELHNRYAYGDVNPIMRVDPTGRAASPDTILNGVVSGLAVVLGVIGIASVMLTANISIPVLPMILAGLNVAADGYSFAIAAGGLLAEHAPHLVIDSAARFFTSNEAMWSELFLGLGSLVAGSTTGINLGARAVRSAARANGEVTASGDAYIEMTMFSQAETKMARRHEPIAEAGRTDARTPSGGLPKPEHFPSAIDPDRTASIPMARENRPWAAFGMSEPIVIRPEPVEVIRVDSRPPWVAFDGFTPKGDQGCNLRSFWGNGFAIHGDFHFVSTTPDSEVALELASSNTPWIYKIIAPGGWIKKEKLTTISNFMNESEYTFPGGIRGEFVVSAAHIDVPWLTFTNRNSASPTMVGSY